MTVPSELAAGSEKEGVGPDTGPSGTAPTPLPGLAPPLTAARHRAPSPAAVRHGAPPPPLAVVPRGTPPLAAVPGGSVPREAVIHGAPPLALAAIPRAARPPLAGVPGGAPPLAGAPSTSTSRVILEEGVAAVMPGGGLPPPTHLAALHATAVRFLQGRKEWMAANSAASRVSLCSYDSAGSRYWDKNPLPDETESINGIHPPDFFGLHPVWEGFAVPVKKRGKTNHFYCTFCKKVFSGNAHGAFFHMMKNQNKSCQIPKHLKELLHKKEKAFAERKQDLTARHKESNEQVINLKMDIEKQVAKLMLELTCDQCNAVEDGMPIMVRMLLEKAEKLLECGVQALKIVEGYEDASCVAISFLNQMASELTLSLDDLVVALPSKLNSNIKKMMDEVVVKPIPAASGGEAVYSNSMGKIGIAAITSCSSAVEAAADKYHGPEQLAIRAFASVLDVVPLPCCENSGLPSSSSAVEATADKYHETEQHAIRVFASVLDVVPLPCCEKSGLSSLGIQTEVKAQEVERFEVFSKLICK